MAGVFLTSSAQYFGRRGPNTVKVAPGFMFKHFTQGSDYFATNVSTMAYDARGNIAPEPSGVS